VIKPESIEKPNGSLGQLKPRPEANNWNPFSAKPSLDFAAFVTTLVVVATAEIAIRFFVQIPMHAARLSLDLKQLGTFYAVWTVVSVFGFFFVANAFIKRWATIYQMPSSPKWMKTVARLFMISPLLSLWATLYTLMFAKDGVVFQDGEKRTVVFATAVGTLILFHAGFLGWSLTQKTVHFSRGNFHLVNDVSMRDSLSKILPGVRGELWLPDETFHVHAYPYLSPLMKLSLSIYGDFARAKSLSDQIKKEPNVFCNDVPAYAGETVPNCFLTRYRDLAHERAFVTPAFGIVYESMYRQELMKDAAKPANAMQSFAMNTISIDNIVTLLEPGELLYNRDQFTRPIGMLALFGSPELPAIALGQDLQHQLLASKFLPLISPQISKLSKNVEEMNGALTPAQGAAARERLATLAHRLKVLESDPLALQPASP
jgi:hypothetical protein